jgi:hypothetical protein
LRNKEDTMEKYGAPSTKATMLLAEGHAKTLEEAQELIDDGKFETLMRMGGRGEKLAGVRTRYIREQLKNVKEEQ